jgi:putative phosphoribosyl transferase
MLKSFVMPLPFRNRTEAGQFLAGKMNVFKNQSDVLVLALPRGGVPVAFEVAMAIRAPLDVFVVRKLGVPGHEELAFGAIATGGVRVLSEDVIHSMGLSREQIDRTIAREQAELERRESDYRGDRPAPNPSGRRVVLVDDGLATGATMLAAIRALRQENPAEIIVGVPVAAPAACSEFEPEVDAIICAVTPEPFYAVGLWYEDFTQTTDEEVRQLLDEASQRVLTLKSGEL